MPSIITLSSAHYDCNVIEKALNMQIIHQSFAVSLLFLQRAYITLCRVFIALCGANLKGKYLLSVELIFKEKNCSLKS